MFTKFKGISMKKMMTKLCVSLMILSAVVIASSNDMLAAKKRILLEQHTGAWCGWCPDGTVVMDKLIEKYPDQVVGVKWHNGDAMVLTEQATFASTFGITGYPAGTVDRVKFGQAAGISRGSWASAVESLLEVEPVVDVATNFTFNEAKDSIFITVDVTVLKNDNRQLALNAYVVEDNCTGSGSKWDQKNYMANNASFVGHPYYNKPATITGYHHMKTLRKVLGGLLGDKTIFPATVKQGDVYSKTFGAAISSEWDIEELYAIGLVQVATTNDRTILNCSESEKFELRAKLAVNEPTLLVNQGENFTKQVTVSNYRDFAIDVDLSIVNAPNGWDVSFENSTISVPANSSAQGNLIVKAPAGGNAEFGMVTFSAIPSDKENWTTFPASEIVYALTSNTKNLVIGMNPNISQFTNVMKQMEGYASATVQVPYSFDIIKAFPVTLFDFVAFASGYSTRGIFSTPDEESQALRDYVRAAIANGTKLLFSSELELYNIFKAQTPTPDAVSLFGTTLGIGITGNPIQVVLVNSQGSITGYSKLNARGIDGDPITDGLTFDINAAAANNASKRLYYVENLAISDSEIATPIIEYLDPTSGAVLGNGGARIQLPTTRVVFLSYGFEGTSDLVKPELAENIVKWLFGTVSVKETATADGNLTMSLSPNPVVNSANFEYTVNGSAQQVTINVVDVTGKIVAELVNGEVYPGTYNVNFDASKYLNGSYHILANVAGSTAQLPVVIVK